MEAKIIFKSSDWQTTNVKPATHQDFAIMCGFFFFVFSVFHWQATIMGPVSTRYIITQA